MEYKRVLLKLSGEALAKKDSIYDKNVLENITYQIKYLLDKNIEVAIVIGGGNVFRGKSSDSFGFGDDTKAGDYMGMMATTINGLALKTFLKERDIPAYLMNSFEVEDIAEKVDASKAKEMIKEKVIIFGGGTGKPYLSTDTAAAMRAIDIDADLILMAKNGVDGVYDTDPKKNPSAKFLPEISFDEVISQGIKVVDHEAMKMLKGKNIDIVLFNMNIPNNIINLFEDDRTKKTIIKN